MADGLLVEITYYIKNILGDYSLQYTNSGELVEGLAGLDWVWITSAVILILSFWFVYRVFLSMVRRV